MTDWVPYDVAHFAIGRALGVFAQDWDDTPPHMGVLFNTANPLSDALGRMAEELVKIGYLDHDPAGQRYRLKPGFDLKPLVGEG